MKRSESTKIRRGLSADFWDRLRRVDCVGLRPNQQKMALSAAPSPPAPSVSADEAIAAAAQWSAPLLRDVLTVELLDEDLEATALGVALRSLALLEEHTLPGWLPGLLDEQRCPLSAPMPPTPSFCFTEDHGAVPIGVVRLNARCHSPHDSHPRRHTSTSQPAPLSSTRIRAKPATRRCTNTSCSSSSVCA